MPDANGWHRTTIGTLSAFEAHNPGDIIGCKVHLVVDHPGPNHGAQYGGVLTAMGRSEFSQVYYHLEIVGGSDKIVHKLDLPLSHTIKYLPKDAVSTVVSTEDERRAKYASLDRITGMREFCTRGTCRKEIKMQIFKGTGFCGTNCYKVAHGQSIEPNDSHPKGTA